MANKRLSTTELDELKQLVLDATSPEDLATRFGISISSVHNHKNRLKKSGLEFPSVRGKRPSGIIETQHSYVSNIPRTVNGNGSVNHTNGHTVNGNGHTHTVDSSLATNYGQNGEKYTLVVNGISVNILKNQVVVVNIGPDKMEIVY